MIDLVGTEELLRAKAEVNINAVQGSHRVLHVECLVDRVSRVLEARKEPSRHSFQGNLVKFCRLLELEPLFLSKDQTVTLGDQFVVGSVVFGKPFLDLLFVVCR